MTSTEFLQHYIETALWSSHSTDDEGQDFHFDSADYELAPETLAKFTADCLKFQEGYPAIVGDAEFDESKVAHDFWLTRNRHGAGFWDGDYPKEMRIALTDYAHSFGECELYLGDDGKIHS